MTEEANRRQAIEEEIRAYAISMAGTGVDLDPALEAAGIECWLERERRDEASDSPAPPGGAWGDRETPRIR